MTRNVLRACICLKDRSNKPRVEQEHENDIMSFSVGDRDVEEEALEASEPEEFQI